LAEDGVHARDISSNGADAADILDLTSSQLKPQVKKLLLQLTQFPSQFIICEVSQFSGLHHTPP